MKLFRGRDKRRAALVLAACVGIAIIAGGRMRGADQTAPNPVPVFRQYCFQCHANASVGAMSLDQLASQSPAGEGFDRRQKVVAVLGQNRMPPKVMPQAGDAERRQAIAWIRAELNAYIKQHDGDPGRVTVRRAAGDPRPAPKLGTGDRRKLDEYLESVRDIADHGGWQRRRRAARQVRRYFAAAAGAVVRGGLRG